MKLPKNYLIACPKVGTAVMCPLAKPPFKAVVTSTEPGPYHVQVKRLSDGVTLTLDWRTFTHTKA